MAGESSVKAGLNRDKEPGVFVTSRLCNFQ